MAVAKRFLTSFIRRDELLGAVPPDELRPGPEGGTEWQAAIADTTRDTLIRGLEGSGDIAAVEASVSDRRLWLRVTTRRSLSPRLTYTIRLHPLGQGEERAGPVTIPIRRLRSAVPVATGSGAGRDLQVSVPPEKPFLPGFTPLSTDG